MQGLIRAEDGSERTSGITCNVGSLKPTEGQQGGWKKERKKESWWKNIHLFVVYWPKSNKSRQDEENFWAQNYM